MLLRIDLLRLKNFALRNVWQTEIAHLLVSVFLLLFLLAFLVDRHISGERNRITACAEDITAGTEISHNGIKLCGLHLACHKTLPNKLIELKLLACQIFFYHCRLDGNV